MTTNSSVDHSTSTGTAIAIGGSVVVLLWFGLAYLLCTVFWPGGAPWPY
jgi:hypothetical protein